MRAGPDKSELKLSLGIVTALLTLVLQSKYFEMRPFFTLILFITVFFYSCKQSNSKSQDTSDSVLSNKQRFVDDSFNEGKPVIPVASANSGTLTVDRRCAVYFEADSMQIEAAKRKIGEQDFYTVADDYLFYISEATQFFDKKKLPILKAGGRKKLRFISSKGGVEEISLDFSKELWGMYLFDPSKAPHKIDITAAEEEYNKYFGKS